MKMIGMATLGRDAELRHLPDGTAVLSMALAYNFGKKQEGGAQPTQWVDASMYGRRAESIAPFLLKGAKHCFTLDECSIDQFARKDGSTGVKLKARVLDVEFSAKAAANAPAAQVQRQAPPAAAPTFAPKPGSGFDDMDDDIPF